MDRHIEDNLEDYLQALGHRQEGSERDEPMEQFERRLSQSDDATREQVRLFSETAQLLRTLRAPDSVEPAPGFYAHVMERVESQRSASLWSAFLNPQFSQRLAVAALCFLVLLGVTLFSSDFQPSVVASQADLVAAPEYVLAEPEEPIVVNFASQPEYGRNEMLVQLTAY
jgi:hypothetical protein